MNNFIEGLLLLEGMSGFRNNSHEATILSRNYQLIKDPFDYFMRCLAVSRGLREEHKKVDCPSEINILASVLEEAASSGQQTFAHVKECYACEHMQETYAFFVKNVWRSLESNKAFLIASLVLAYLQGDSPDEILGALERIEEDGEEDYNEGSPFLKGVLVVKEFDGAGKTKNVWYGLARRAFEIMGSTLCMMCPLTDDSPVFRLDLTNDRKMFYFMSWHGVKEEGGLKFNFGPNDKLIFQDERCFTQKTIGVSLRDPPKEKKKWEAFFYGTIS